MLASSHCPGAAVVCVSIRPRQHPPHTRPASPGVRVWVNAQPGDVCVCVVVVVVGVIYGKECVMACACVRVHAHVCVFASE